MSILFLLGLALAPIIFLMSFIYFQDKHEKEPLRFMVISFLLGVAAIFPSVIFELFYEWITPFPAINAFGKLCSAFVGVALIEEGFKAIVLNGYMFKKSHFNEPYDGIVYGVSVSMGFAALENIMYVLEHGYVNAIMRMFTAVPGHFMFGVLMGFFFGIAKFHKNPKMSLPFRMIGVLAAIIPHGLYDYFLFMTDQIEWFFILALVVLVICIFLSIKAIRLHVKVSPFKKNKIEQNPNSST